MPLVFGNFRVKYTANKGGDWLPFGSSGGSYDWVLNDGHTGTWDVGGDATIAIDTGSGYGSFGDSFPAYSEITTFDPPGGWPGTAGDVPPNVFSESYNYDPFTFVPNLTNILGLTYSGSVTSHGGGAQITTTELGFIITSGSFIVPDPPSISFITPPGGPPDGGTFITIHGAHFVDGVTVLLGGSAVGDLVFVDSSTLTGTAPPHALGSVRGDATNPNGQTGGRNNVYVYFLPPLDLTAVTPDVGGTEGADPVQLIGSGFLSGITVTFDGVAASDVVVASDTSLFCLTPPHAVGYVDVAVTNVSGTDPLSATLVNGFLYQLIVTAPTPDAGAPQVVRGPLPIIIQTDAVVVRGRNNGTLSYLWEAREDNPTEATFTITSPTDLNTTITSGDYFPGDYYFVLTTTDEGGYFSVQSELHINVPPPVPPAITIPDAHVGG